MHSLAALRQETCDRTIRVRWSNQLDPTRSRVKRHNLNRLLSKHEPFAIGKTKRLVARERLIKICHDNRDMVQHRIDVPRRSGSGTTH